MTPLLEVRGLTKHFAVHRGWLQRRQGLVRALEEVDLTVHKGECFAVVGESGSGKTTLARCIIRLLEPTSGSVRFDGEELTTLGPRQLRPRRRRFQMIFQDPYGSLNPRMRVAKILAEPLAVHNLVPRAGRPRRVKELLDLVGLSPEAAGRYPHQFSGGQRQRVGIARALATEPDLLIADEPVSALDVSVRAQIVNLITRLQQELGLTVLFIAHDLALVEQIADRVAVMYLGRLVEVAPAPRLFAQPQHPYTISLLSAVPVPEPVPEGGRRRARIVLKGETPSPLAPPPGCPFHPRCPIARERCAIEVPSLSLVGEGHTAACHYPGELEREAVAARVEAP